MPPDGWVLSEQEGEGGCPTRGFFGSSSCDQHENSSPLISSPPLNVEPQLDLFRFDVCLHQGVEDGLCAASGFRASEL